MASWSLTKGTAGGAGFSSAPPQGRRIAVSWSLATSCPQNSRSTTDWLSAKPSATYFMDSAAAPETGSGCTGLGRHMGRSCKKMMLMQLDTKSPPISVRKAALSKDPLKQQHFKASPGVYPELGTTLKALWTK